MVGAARVWDCLFRTAAREHGKGFLPHPARCRWELSDNFPDLDPDFCRVGFRAEYSKTGFAITRLIPVYNYSRPAFEVYPESSPRDLVDLHQSAVDSAREQLPGVAGSLEWPTESWGISKKKGALVNGLHGETFRLALCKECSEKREPRKLR